MTRFLLRTVALLGLSTLWAPRATAQTLREQTQPASGRTPTQVISVNPFLPLFGYFQGEYEHRVAANASIAVSGAHMRLDDLYTSVDVKLRMYPQERVLEKLGLSAGVGYGRIQREVALDCSGPFDAVCAPQQRNQSAPTFAVEAQYQWLLGTSRATAVGFGGGVKRFFVPDNKAEGLERVVPTLRLTIGYAF